MDTYFLFNLVSFQPFQYNLQCSSFVVIDILISLKILEIKGKGERSGQFLADPFVAIFFFIILKVAVELISNEFNVNHTLYCSTAKQYFVTENIAAIQCTTMQI